jgi:uncharacterized protein YbjT (DUF2867 family)
VTVAVSGPQRPLILLTGATGCIGGRVLHALEARGERVRCLSRRPEYLSARVGPGTEVVHGDVLGPETLCAALKDVETAYYLVHSMGSSGSFAKADREAASAFGARRAPQRFAGSSTSAGSARVTSPTTSPRARKSAASCAGRASRRSSSAHRS